MPMQPSASRTALLLACPRPFEVELELEPASEAARYGSAFHQVIAWMLTPRANGKPYSPDLFSKEVDRATVDYDVIPARSELAAHVKGSFKVLKHWLEREELEVVALEKAYAVRPYNDGAVDVRRIAPHDESHQYADATANEVPATVDLIAFNAHRTRAIVLDHKTGNDWGENFARPVQIAQMRTLGLVIENTPTREVAIFHADRQGLPYVYAEEYEPHVARAHAMALRHAIEMISSGFLRPGPECKYCPARTDCPAWRADLLADSTAALVRSANALADEPVDPKTMLAAPVNGSSLESRAGALYDLLKRFRALDEAGMAEIKRLVRAGAVIETREGELVLRTQAFETISKKSIVAALGKVNGERQLKRLRDKGALNESTREVLTVDKHRANS